MKPDMKNNKMKPEPEDTLSKAELRFLFAPYDEPVVDEEHAEDLEELGEPQREGWTLRDYIDAPFYEAKKLLRGANIAPLLSTAEAREAVREAANLADAETLSHTDAGVSTESATTSELRDEDLGRGEVDATGHRPPCLQRALLNPLGFSNRLLLLLDEHPVIAMYGSAGCGKTTLLKSQLIHHDGFRRRYPTVMHVDCKALGMRSPSSLARELIWAQFGLDEDGFTQFSERMNFHNGGLEREQRAHETDPIHAYLTYRFSGNPGLIVLDHTDSLSTNGAVSSFLTKSLFPAAKDLGLRILMSQRAKPFKKQERILSVGHSIAFPQFTTYEISNWLNEVTSLRSSDLGFDGKALFDEIGPRPELLDTFRAYLKHAKTLDRNAIKRFVDHRINFGHLPDCERFVRATRRSPALFRSLIQSGGELTPDVLNICTDASLKRIILSGAVRYANPQSPKREELVYSSNLHRKRMEILYGPDAFATLILRGSEPEMHNGGAWDFLKRYREFSSSGVGVAISAETEPAMGLKRFQSFMRRWRIDSEIYVRDQENARLWAPLDRMEQLDRFQSRLQPQFAETIQTGTSVKCHDGRWFVPVAGSSGLISMVLRVRFETAHSEWLERAHLLALESLIEGLKGSLSHVMQRLAFHFERQRTSKAAIMSRDQLAGHNGLLQSIGCAGWAILEREDQSGAWFVSRVEATGANSSACELTNQLTDMCTESLDRHAFHPSGRGIVIKGEKTGVTFPNLQCPLNTVYLQPVSRSSDHKRAVVFIFNTTKDLAITGVTQKQLVTVAINLVAA